MCGESSPAHPLPKSGREGWRQLDGGGGTQDRERAEMNVGSPGWRKRGGVGEGEVRGVYGR